MRKICGPAMNRKPAFGENQMRILGDAEIRFAVADHDFERAMPAAGTMTAFAVAQLRGAATARKRKGKSPAIAPLPLQAVGKKRQVRTGGAQNATDHPVQAIGQDDNPQPPAPAKIHESGKLRVDDDRREEPVDGLGRRSQQVHLPGHASA